MNFNGVVKKFIKISDCHYRYLQDCFLYLSCLLLLIGIKSIRDILYSILSILSQGLNGIPILKTVININLIREYYPVLYAVFFALWIFLAITLLFLRTRVNKDIVKYDKLNNQDKKFVKKIEQSLSDERQNIIWLTGPWGSGKTKLINKIFENNQDIIYISCFGLAKREQVISEIKSQLEDASIFRKLFSIPIVGGFFKVLVQNQGLQVLKKGKPILILDDFERIMSPNLLDNEDEYFDEPSNYNEILGLIEYISYMYVNVKVMVILDDAKLKNTIKYIINPKFSPNYLRIPFSSERLNDVIKFYSGDNQKDIVNDYCVLWEARVKIIGAENQNLREVIGEVIGNEEFDNEYILSDQASKLVGLIYRKYQKDDVPRSSNLSINDLKSANGYNNKKNNTHTLQIAFLIKFIILQGGQESALYLKILNEFQDIIDRINYNGALYYVSMGKIKTRSLTPSQIKIEEMLLAMIRNKYIEVKESEYKDILDAFDSNYFLLLLWFSGQTTKILKKSDEVITSLGFVYDYIGNISHLNRKVETIEQTMMGINVSEWERVVCDRYNGSLVGIFIEKFNDINNDRYNQNINPIDDQIIDYIEIIVKNKQIDYQDIYKLSFGLVNSEDSNQAISILLSNYIDTIFEKDIKLPFEIKGMNFNSIYYLLIANVTSQEFLEPIKYFYENKLLDAYKYTNLSNQVKIKNDIIVEYLLSIITNNLEFSYLNSIDLNENDLKIEHIKIIICFFKIDDTLCDRKAEDIIIRYLHVHPENKEELSIFMGKLYNNMFFNESIKNIISVGKQEFSIQSNILNWINSITKNNQYH
ncbi:hypothetical protein WA99_01585 [Streptococcus agalactiae]|uniref:ATP-binding protein n=1 Tax=Streptococcus agalactiae TaxID=1311 RepID=UPI0006400D91|nr:ATP-binding protein [Streptococcus agalactiae]KLJ82622.1 hypothetical protein WA99_01585 [Streptococcus agalactiae]